MERFKNILFIANSELNDTEALERAVTLAISNQAQLTVVSIVEKFKRGHSTKSTNISLSELHKALKDERQSELESLILPFSKKIQVNTKVLEGTPFLVAIHEVLRTEIDLVIKSVENTDVMDRLLGSTDMNLLRKCPCPVWLIKPDLKGSFDIILAAVDVDDSYPEDQVETQDKLNHQILKLASSIALSEFAKLHVVSVWNTYGEGLMRTAMTNISEEKIATFVEQTRRHHESSLESLMQRKIRVLGKEALEYFKPETHLIKGVPRKEIPTFADKIDADLVVMGTVGRTGIPGFIMGNTAETILNKLDCSILALKPVGFVTPVTLDDKG